MAFHGSSPSLLNEIIQQLDFDVPHFEPLYPPSCLLRVLQEADPRPLLGVSLSRVLRFTIHFAGDRAEITSLPAWPA